MMKKIGQTSFEGDRCTVTVDCFGHNESVLFLTPEAKLDIFGQAIESFGQKWIDVHLHEVFADTDVRRYTGDIGMLTEAEVEDQIREAVEMLGYECHFVK